jgi:hypothetical protein
MGAFGDFAPRDSQLEERFRTRYMAKRSRIIKVAGLSLAGFCAVSLIADKVAISPETSQVAGYCGAFLGALVGRGRGRGWRSFRTLEESSDFPESEVAAAEREAVPADPQ